MANRLTEEGFAVSMEFEEITKKIFRSDCVICRNTCCQQEANYVQQIGKAILPIKIQYYQSIDWLKKLIEKESIFHLYGSENQFNFEYEKILSSIHSIRYWNIFLSTMVEQTGESSNQIKYRTIYIHR